MSERAEMTEVTDITRSNGATEPHGRLGHKGHEEHEAVRRAAEGGTREAREPKTSHAGNMGGGLFLGSLASWVAACCAGRPSSGSPFCLRSSVSPCKTVSSVRSLSVVARFASL